MPASTAFVTDSNRLQTASATSSNRLSNRCWGRLCGPFPSNASLPSSPPVPDLIAALPPTPFACCRTVRDLEGRLHEACERPQGRSDGAAAAEDTELRSAVQRLEKQVVDLTAARGSLLAEKEAVMRESYDRMQRFEAACAKLQRQPREDGAPGNGVAGDAAALEAQCTALRERVQAMEGQCAEWERAAEEADRQLQSERALGRGLQTELDARAQAADAALRRAEDVEVQWRQLQGTVNELDRQLEAERARAAAAQPQHAADAGLAEAVELLEAQVVALTEERAARLTTELSEAQAHMARLEAVETLARRHQQLVADGGGQGELEELRRRAEEGERQVAVKAQEAETARQEAMMCLAEIQELKRKGGSSPAPDSRKALEDAQKENAQLKQVLGRGVVVQGLRRVMLSASRLFHLTAGGVLGMGRLGRVWSGNGQGTSPPLPHAYPRGIHGTRPPMPCNPKVSFGAIITHTSVGTHRH